MHIPLFEDTKHFVDFCNKAEAKDIQAMSPLEWNMLYASIEDLSLRTYGKNQNRNFLRDHKHCFKKLYKNFRYEKPYLEKLVAFARETADAWSKNHPDFFTLYLAMEVVRALPHQKTRDILSSICDTVYSQGVKSSIKNKLLKPELIVCPKDCEEGGYLQRRFSSKIEINDNSADYIQTTAHEVFHALQLEGADFYKNLLKVVDRKNKFNSPEMSELYRNNQRYYLKHCKEYMSQPLEYGARLFGYLFSRRVNHNFHTADYNKRQMFTTMQSLYHFNYVYDPSTEMNIGKEKFELIYSNLSKKSVDDLKILSEKFLGGKMENLPDNKVKVSFATDTQTKLRTDKFLSEVQEYAINYPNRDLAEHFLHSGREAEKVVQNQKNMSVNAAVYHTGRDN